jgi:hypothetical protein
MLIFGAVALYVVILPDSAPAVDLAAGPELTMIFPPPGQPMKWPPSSTLADRADAKHRHEQILGALHYAAGYEIVE